MTESDYTSYSWAIYITPDQLFALDCPELTTLQEAENIDHLFGYDNRTGFAGMYVRYLKGYLCAQGSLLNCNHELEKFHAVLEKLNAPYVLVVQPADAESAFVYSNIVAEREALFTHRLLEQHAMGMLTPLIKPILKPEDIVFPNGSVAKNSSEAFKIEEKFKGKPNGWVQWKGTSVCMDIYCKCGYHSHIDESFAYHVQCPNCKTIYACNGHIELIELEEEPANCVIKPPLDTDEMFN